MNTKTKL